MAALKLTVKVERLGFRAPFRIAGFLFRHPWTGRARLLPRSAEIVAAVALFLCGQIVTAPDRFAP